MITVSWIRHPAILFKRILNVFFFAFDFCFAIIGSHLKHRKCVSGTFDELSCFSSW